MPDSGEPWCGMEEPNSRHVLLAIDGSIVASVGTVE